MKTIYLDNNATTKVDEEVFESIKPYFCEKYGNPSSMHEFGGLLADDIAIAREKVANMLGAKDAKEIFFTASGSESCNTAYTKFIICICENRCKL